MAILDVTREYIPGSCRNLRKPVRLPTCREMKPDSLALHSEQYRVPSQTCSESRFACWKYRRSPRTLSQDEDKTDVTYGTQNSSVYPKSSRDEAHFPCMGSIAILCSTSYKASRLTSFRNIQRFPEKPVSSLEEYHFHPATRGKLHAPHIISRRELIPRILLKR